MPQMAPMPWVSLMIGVLGVLMVFVSVVGTHPVSMESEASSKRRPEGGNWRW